MLYLIHFDRPYRHAQHYRGYCKDGKLLSRLRRHRQGKGARLLAVVRAAGIKFHCVRVLHNGTRAQERLLKKRGLVSICPICNPKLCTSTGA